MKGKEDQDPFNDIDDKYLCSICLDILQKPCTLKTCKHSMCKQCFEQFIKTGKMFWFNQSGRCPKCQYEFNKKDAEQSKDLLAQLNSQEIKCICGEEIKLINYREHQEKCVKISQNQEKIQSQMAEDMSKQVKKPVVNRSTFKCPICDQKNLDRIGLLEHCNNNHTKSQSAVCPICACQPWGDPNKQSRNFQQHLKLRHQFDLQEHGDYQEDQDDALQRILQLSLQQQ